MIASSDDNTAVFVNKQQAVVLNYGQLDIYLDLRDFKQESWNLIQILTPNYCGGISSSWNFQGLFGTLNQVFWLTLSL